MDKNITAITSRGHERGAILVLISVSITLLMLLVALSVDIGWIVVAEGQLQHTSDSSALAGAALLRDKDALYGTPDQSDDIPISREYSRQYVEYQTVTSRSITIDPNEANNIDGDIVVGYLADPTNQSSVLEIDSIPKYNSVQVETKLSQEINGPLGLFLGAITGSNDVEVTTRATATLDDRIVGFSVNDGESLPMLPFTIWKDTWYDQRHSPPPDGMTSWDNYRVEDGVVSYGSDGIPEIYAAMFKPDEGIPGQTGNCRTSFVAAVVGTTYVRNQIYNGMNETDLDAVSGLKLMEDGEGGFYKWLPGEHWMSSSWHSALRYIKGETRIVSLFETLSIGSSPPTACAYPLDDLSGLLKGKAFSLPETCCGIYEYHEITEFKAVTVCDSQWPSDETQRYFVLQPAQITTETAIINPDMPNSETIYSLSLTR